MDEILETPIRRPIRRRKTRAEIIKESCLPFWILLAAIVVILILIIGAAGRNAEAAQTALWQIGVL